MGSSPTLSISRLSSMVRAQIIKGILYKVRAAILFREDSGVVGSIPTVGFILDRGFTMSRSYKHTPVYKNKIKYGKRCANKKVRRDAKQKPYDAIGGKSNLYRKEYESWEICDYRHWGEPIWREESWLNLRDYPGIWQKCYRRK